MIHFITPCSRPQNLKTIEDSFLERVKQPYHWWVIQDGRRQCTVEPGRFMHTTFLKGVPDRPLGVTPEEIEHGFAAGFLRNVAVNQISDGWIYGLDDDTIMHPALEAQLKDDKYLVGFTVIRADGTLYVHGTPIGAQDIAGYAWRREHFPDIKFNEYGTQVDSQLWHQLWQRCAEDRRIITNDAAGYYNYIQDRSVSMPEAEAPKTESAPVEAPTEAKKKWNWTKKADPLDEADPELAAMVRISAIMKGLRQDSPLRVRQWFHQRYCEKLGLEKEAPK